MIGKVFLIIAILLSFSLGNAVVESQTSSVYKGGPSPRPVCTALASDHDRDAKTAFQKNSSTVVWSKKQEDTAR
jgi:hypothetical protein